MLRIILNNEELTVLSARTQETLRNTAGRSICLDIKAEDADGNQFNVEIQKDPRNASIKRARYHASMLDVSALKKGENFDQLPDTVVIFITETDVLGYGLPVYTIDTTIRETGERIDTGSNIIYLNGSIQDETAIGKLIHDLQCADPEKMYYPELKESVHNVKNVKEEKDRMRDLIQEHFGDQIEAAANAAARRQEEKSHREKLEGIKEILRLGTVSAEYAAAAFKISPEEVFELEQQIKAESAKLHPAS